MIQTNPPMDIETFEAIIREERTNSPTVSSNQPASGDVPTKEPLAQPPQANERALATLFIELPATNQPRSRVEAFSLKESYLSLHQEFISCDHFLGYLSEPLHDHSEISELLAGSFADGPIPLFEILRNRLFFRLEKTSGGSRSPILVVEALGETTQAAKRLAELVQSEYLRFISKGEALTAHPKLARFLTKFNETQRELRSLENDLEAFRRLNKEPAQKDNQAELQARLRSCQTDKRRQVAHLREIIQAFAANPEDIGALVDLGGFAEFEQLRLQRDNLRKLESSTRKYRIQGNQAAVAVHEKAVQSMRKGLQTGVHLTIAVLKERLQRLLDREMALSESLAAGQNDFTELAQKYPKLQQLQATRRSAAKFEAELKHVSSTWNRARKLLRVGSLSKPLPPLYVQPLVP